jgi:hypothetical protein
MDKLLVQDHQGPAPFQVLDVVVGRLAGLLGYGEADPLAGPEHPAGGVGGAKPTWRPPASRTVTLMQTDPGTLGSASGHGLRATLTRVAATSGVESAWPAPGLGSWPRGHRATARTPARSGRSPRPRPAWPDTEPSLCASVHATTQIGTNASQPPLGSGARCPGEGKDRPCKIL